MNVSDVIDKTLETAKEIFGGEKKSSVHSWMGSNPHAEFEQSHPAVNKEEPAAFANPEEAGAKRASEDVIGKPMPKPDAWTHARSV